VAALTTAIQSALDIRGATPAVLGLACSGLVIVFAMWWLYFAKPAEQLLTSAAVGCRWGYGHLLIFSAAAAVGSGLQVAIDYDAGRASLSAFAAGATTAVPVAAYLLTVWGLQLRPHHHGLLPTIADPLTAVLILAAAATPLPHPLIALLLATLVTTSFLISEPWSRTVIGRQPAEDSWARPPCTTSSRGSPARP